MGLLPWFPSAHNPCLVVNLCSYSAYTLAPLTYLALAAVAGHLHRPCLTLVLGVPLKSCPGVALATMLFFHAVYDFAASRAVYNFVLSQLLPVLCCTFIRWCVVYTLSTWSGGRYLKVSLVDLFSSSDCEFACTSYCSLMGFLLLGGSLPHHS